MDDAETIEQLAKAGTGTDGEKGAAFYDEAFTTTEEYHTTDLLAGQYDAALSTEFLDHVEQEMDVLAKLRPGTLFIGTVPNFAYVSHVRHFKSVAEVVDRYGRLFSALDVCAIPANDQGKTFYLMQGVRR